VALITFPIKIFSLKDICILSEDLVTFLFILIYFLKENNSKNWETGGKEFVLRPVLL